MRAKDIMTTPVVTITPDTTVRQVAALLLERGFSGLPVVDKGRVVGIVSEGDLLRRHEIGSDRRRPAGPWWKAMFQGLSDPAEYVRSHAVRAADVMSTRVISVTEDTALAKVAALFEKRRIKRLPVLRGERLVGLVTRANLVRALAETSDAAAAPGLHSDETIRILLLRELGAHAWWPATSNATVSAGVVHFWGIYDSEDARRAARVAAENIPGVRGIEDHRIGGASLPAMG